MKKQSFNIAGLLVFIPLLIMVFTDLQKWFGTYKQIKETAPVPQAPTVMHQFDQNQFKQPFQNQKADVSEQIA